MSNKVIAKLCAMLVIICIALTTVATAFAVEEIVGDTPSADPVVSSQISSVEQSSAPVEKPIAPTPSVPSIDAPVESSEPSVVSSEEAPTSTQTDIVSSVNTQSVASVVESSEPTESKKTESYKESSSKKTSSKKTSSKKTSSKKTSSKKTKPKPTSSKKDDYVQESVSSFAGGTTSYHTPSYNDGSLSEDWENNDDVVISTKEEGKELSDHVFDPKKAVAAWIWLPILIALACIGVLIYVNVYVYNRGAHSGGGPQKNVDDDEDVYEENEEEPYTEEENKEDPYSAVNFFKFDDDE